MLDFLIGNFGQISALVLAILTVAEIIVRFTPTKKDDSVVERIGSVIRKILDVIKLPNKSKRK